MKILTVLQIVCGACLGMAVSGVQAGQGAHLFDKPVREVHLPLPPDPLNPQAKTELSCFYYPGFMVKQVDMGEKGAEQLSVLGVKDAANSPDCVRENQENEKVIDGRDVWSGYFLGAKGWFLFFSGGDANGGDGLAVFSATTGFKLYDDLAGAIHAIGLVTPFQHEHDPAMQKKVLQLRYQRVYVADCSLRVDEKKCWQSIRQLTGLRQANPPDCRAAYRKMFMDYPGHPMAEVNADPSVIEYGMEVMFDEDGAILHATPVSPAKICRPGD